MALMDDRSTRVYDERIVWSPLTDEMFRPIRARFSSVQLKTPLTDGEYKRVAAFMEQHPKAVLTVAHAYEQQITDLEFLRFFPFLRLFVVHFRALESLDGLRHLSDSLETLGVRWSKRPLDLSVLRQLKRVRTLEIESHKKHIDALSQMRWLEDLTLRSITLPDLSLLLPLSALLSLDIKLGGTKDLSLLPRIGKLRYLELWMIKGLSDISRIGELTELRYLFLQALKNVTVLPDLSRATHLSRVHLETMKGLRDLRPLATAPALKQLALVDMRHLQPEDLQCLVGHPTLKAVTPGLGSNRKNAAAASLLGLPESSFPEAGEWRHL